MNAKLGGHPDKLDAKLFRHSTISGGPHVLSLRVLSVEVPLNVLDTAAVSAAVSAIMAAVLKHRIVFTLLEPY